MTECKDQRWLFQDLGNRKVEVDFGGGYLSSDGGGLILNELERHHGLLRDLSGCFVDYRDQRYVEHTVQELLSQRIYGLVLGYEDLNDHDHLRRDPVHGLICGKSDPLGQDRLQESDKGKALAAHSTLNRLELSAHGIDLRYHKIEAQPEQIEALLIERAVKAIPRKSAEIVLDFDATDDPLHGSQEGAYFNGYYRAYCYLPLYCFCGNIPLLAKLRDCKRDASEGSLEALQKIVAAIRRRFGKKVRIILARNDRLNEELKGAFESLNAQIKDGKLESPCRSFTEFEYSTLKSWSKARRVIGKAEILPKGDNRVLWSPTYPRRVGAIRSRRPDSKRAPCTRSFTAPGVTWKTASKSSSWICLPIAPALIGWVPTNCTVVFGLCPSVDEYSTSRSLKGHRACPGLDRPDPFAII